MRKHLTSRSAFDNFRTVQGIRIAKESPMHELDTLSVLVADRRRERETAAASQRLATHTPARRRAAGTLRRLADWIDTPRVSAPRPGLGTGRGT
jgi:hypothetical protein